MKKLLVLASVCLPLVAQEKPLDIKTVEKIETAVQVAGVGLASYGLWQAITTWNSPECGQLYTDLVSVYTHFLDRQAVSGWDRFLRLGQFKLFEIQRQLSSPIVAIMVGAEIALLVAVAKIARAQAQAAELELDNDDLLLDEDLDDQELEEVYE